MAAGDLTDLATCYVTCDIVTSTAATDAILSTFITALSAYVPNVINREILADNYIEFYNGNDKANLMLRQRPVLQITSVSWQGQTYTAIGDPIAGTTGVWTDGRNARLVNDTFPAGSTIQVAYSAGYTTVPADVKLAVAELVAEAYQRRTHVGENSRSAAGAITISFDPKTMHNAIADKLNNYMAVVPC